MVARYIDAGSKAIVNIPRAFDFSSSDGFRKKKNSSIRVHIRQLFPSRIRSRSRIARFPWYARARAMTHIRWFTIEQRYRDVVTRKSLIRDEVSEIARVHVCVLVFERGKKINKVEKNQEKNRRWKAIVVDYLSTIRFLLFLFLICKRWYTYVRMCRTCKHGYA